MLNKDTLILYNIVNTTRFRQEFKCLDYTFKNSTFMQFLGQSIGHLTFEVKSL